MPQFESNVQISAIYPFSLPAIDLLYGAGFILAAILTVPAFDRDVWIRDIDASPSPFPISVLFAFYFPCCCSLPLNECDAPDSPVVPSIPCFPGCNCPAKLPMPITTQPSEITLG